MSFPTIPDVTPQISLNRADVINLLLASIAFEELGLAHVINAEGEKIQSALGTLTTQTPRELTLEELIAIDKSVEKTLRVVIKNQMLLQFKLEDILEIPSVLTQTFTNLATATALFGDLTVQSIDVAYYHTVGRSDAF